MVSRIEITATSATHTKGGGAYDCTNVGVGAGQICGHKIVSNGWAASRTKRNIQRGYYP